MKILGAILAGGKSARMGRDKAGIEVAGTTLAARAQLALEPLVSEVVVLGHGAGCPPALRRVPDHAVAGAEQQGPVAGLAGLCAEDFDLVLVVSCDLPRITTRALRPLLAEGGSAAWDGWPLPAVFTRADIEAVRARFDAGERRLRAVVDALCTARPSPPLQLIAQLEDADAPGDLDERARRVRVSRWESATQDAPALTDDHVAREEPLELRIGGVPVAVVMRTPGHDHELAAGFLLTEAIVAGAEQIARIEHCTEIDDEEAEDNILQVTLTDGTAVDLEKLRRNLYASSSCGVCGKATIEQAMVARGVVEDDTRFLLSMLLTLPEKMRGAQDVFELTGGLHAAALFDEGGALLCLREDVGRHNAVDKVVGWAARSERALRGTVLQVSGRASFEIVQKAANARIPVLSAVSAPSSLAVDAAAALGVTLLGFVRGGRLNAYSRPERLRSG